MRANPHIPKYVRIPLYIPLAISAGFSAISAASEGFVINPTSKRSAGIAVLRRT